jgi:hypothetical protein
MRFRICALLALAAVWSACGGGSPSGPSDAPPANPLEGQTVNALDGSATAGLTVSVGHDKSSTTDGNGYFRIEVNGSASHWLTVYGPGVVNRETMLRGSNGQPARVSLIPASFDLTAFDEMFRSSSKLLRWADRPALVVLGSVMTFKQGGSDVFTATSERLSDQDLAGLVAHLEEGLALLTGNTFTTFASVETERPGAGEQVSVQRTGKIVVGRYQGVEATGAIGYGQWNESSSGAVVGGSMFLDEKFDERDERRRLLRIHELGHALGYSHVTSRDSIMNPTIGSEVMEFDRNGAAIAFQRPPGNRPPDSDGAAGGVTQSVENGRITTKWSDRIPCGRRYSTGRAEALRYGR